MLEYGFVIHILLSLALGFIIGLQREMRNVMTKSKDFGGGRTFAVISLFAYLCAEASQKNPTVLPVALAVVGAILVTSHILHSQSGERRGTTSEFAALVTFAIGASIAFLSPAQVVFIAIVTVFVLHVKEKVQALERFLSKEDLNASVLFLMMTFVVLPLLPNETLDPLGLVNLYKTWLMVVIVSGISFGGYLCVRIFGADRGVWLTGAIGGLISSTAVTLSLSRKATLNPSLSRQIAVGISIASTIMLARVLLIVYLLNQELGNKLMPAFLFSTFCAGVFIVLIARTANNEPIEQSIEYSNPLELKEALAIGFIFGLVIALIKLAKTYVGDAGIYVVSIVSGLADVDPIALSLSDMAKDLNMLNVAVVGIVIAAISNSISKFIIVAVLGSPQLRYIILAYYAIVSLSLGIAAILV